GSITGRLAANTSLTAHNLGTIDSGNALAIMSRNVTLTNDGSITGMGLVSAMGAEIVNIGRMTSLGPATAISAIGLTLTNSGDIIALGGNLNVIDVSMNANIDNSGNITGGDNTIAIRVGGDATIANSGNIIVGDTLIAGQRSVAIEVSRMADVSNSGVIRVGDGGTGLILGDGSTFKNKGDLEVSGAGATGVTGPGALAVQNSGGIAVAGLGATAILGAGALTVDNSGKISATGTNATAIAGMDLLTVTNTGLITVAGTGSTAISSLGALTLTNSGEISAAEGVAVYARASLDLVNRGMISGVTGILVEPGAGPAMIVNDGAIVGTGGNAIVLTDAADTLTLGRNSRVQGRIVLGGGGDTVNLDFSDRRSRILVFDTLAGAAVNVAGSSSWFLSGNSIVDLNPITQYMKNAGVTDVREAVGGIIQGRIEERARADRPMPGFYIKAFAGASFHGSTRQHDAFRNTQFGAILGAEGEAAPNLIVGGFAGGAGSSASTSGSASDRASATYILGGLYGRFSPGMFFIDANVTGGYANASANMNIVSNIAPGGVERLDNGSTGTFVSPEAGIGVNVPINEETTISPALRYRYTATNWNAAKTISTTGLAIGSTSPRASELRAEVQASHKARFDGASFKMYETIGVLRETVSGGDFTLAVNGVSAPGAASSAKSTTGVYAAAGFEWIDESGFAWFASMRGDWRTGNTYRFSARAGAKLNF
ncbi:MAG: autotransporter domain-containing protein, partial [Beijerinckiaceae bacterium]